MSEVIPATIQYIHPLQHGHTKVIVMAMKGQLTSLLYHASRPSHSWDKVVSNFELWNFKAKVMSVIKGQGHVVSPVFNWLASILFHIIQTNNSWVTAISKFDLEIWPIHIRN